ncbi:MAG: PH domain-containing protein [Gammaproteobacteria bacterium]|nr:PH domain-containing protein [Gammaproteobacteria bacterium]
MAEVFPIIPAPMRTLVTLGVIVAALAVLLALFGYLLYATQNISFEVSARGLQVRNDPFRRFIPIENIDQTNIRAIDLERETEYRPRWRTGGTGLPGYKSGWFKLKNGEKALLFLTDYQSAVYIPTTQNYAVILSVAEPQRLVDTLRQAAN